MHLRVMEIDERGFIASSKIRAFMQHKLNQCRLSTLTPDHTTGAFTEHSLN
jgi:hypothetical protein